LEGISAAFLVTPLGPDETDAGLAFIDAAEKAGVQKIVYVAIMNIEAMSEIPHFATKVPIRRRLLESDGHVVIDANFFMQNDLLAGPALKAGVYPLPIGTAGVHSVDARDVGLAAARAMTRTEWDGQAVPVCGPDLITGPRAAEVYSAATGRAFRYLGDEIDPFIGAISAAMPMDDWVENDLRRMMEVTQKMGCPASNEDLERCASILGKPPRSYEAFVQETAGCL
ncbi:MAG: NmrA family NAD(P)-binding protein, partial [Parvularcula sp.]|nr:NmrA family NAD(P)-binding protein [Parvularcula sp.]